MRFNSSISIWGVLLVTLLLVGCEAVEAEDEITVVRLPDFRIGTDSTVRTILVESHDIAAVSRSYDGAGDYSRSIRIDFSGTNGVSLVQERRGLGYVETTYYPSPDYLVTECTVADGHGGRIEVIAVERRQAEIWSVVALFVREAGGGWGIPTTRQVDLLRQYNPGKDIPRILVVGE